MKHNLLKSVIISVILLMGVSNAYAETIMRVYCKQAQSWWNADGAAVGAYAWKSTNTSQKNANYPGVRMSPVNGQTDLWYADIDIDKYDKIIFTRVNASGTIADWGAKTSDLTIANTKNQYTISSSSAVWGDPGVTGSWGTYKPTSTASLTASPTSTYVDNNVTLTPALTSNKDANTYSSTAYTVNPATASVNGNTFKATAAGTYTVTATVTYYAKGCPTLTSTTKATAEITIEAQHSVTISYKCGNNNIKSATTSSVGESTSKSITAPTITGYKFSSWTLGNGITNKSANTTTNPISITTKSSGTYTLTANYTEDLTSTWHIVGDPTSIFKGTSTWAAHDDNMLKKTTGASTASKGSLTIDVKTLPASNDSYQFKVLNTTGTIWYGWSKGDNHYWMNKTQTTSVYTGSDNGNNLYFIPDALGEYKFDVDWSSSNPSLKVTFPTAYAVTFGTGTGGSSVTAKYNSTSFNNGTKVQSGKTVTFTQSASAGYTFKEWNTKSDGTGTKLSTNATYTRTVAATNTVYAIYTKNPDNIVYLKPSHSWKSNNAQFAVKYGGTNYKMTEVEECREEKYYKVTIPSEYSKFNFVRLSDDGTTEWNVTGEISVPTDGKNLYDMTKIYLKPNANWKSGNARFAAYFFDSQDNLNKNKWMSMLPTDEDGVFYCDFPTDHIFDNVSLTRMNGAESYNDWAYRWNQTKDIELFQGYNSYELEEGKWGKDNSNPQKDDEMNVIYKCKWTTYNPTYSVTLEPTPYGHYTVEYNGRTYKSATDKNVVIEDVALGATIRVSKGTPDNSAEYTDDMLLQKASGSGKTELKGGEYYDHTICGTTTITENFVTKNPHTVYLRVPTTLAKWYEEGYATPGANCVYYTHILGGGINLMEDVTGTINGEDGYKYYQFTIPAGYRTFCFQYKSGTTPESFTPRNYTANFTHAMPFINGLNCFTILGSDDDDYYYGEWGTLLQKNDYRLLYIEQKVELENGHPKTIVTKAHPSDIIKYNDTRTTYSLHIYNKVVDGENGMNDPEILVQQWNGSNWITIERHMVFGPLHADFGMAAMPGRRDAAGPDAVLRNDNGIENIKKDINTTDPRFADDQASGVWNFVVTRDNSKNFTGLDLTQTARYTGDYYVRTDCADGGWYNYTNPNNHMTRSDISKQNSNYSHYFCKWVESNNDVNVKFTVANDYGYAISDTLEADRTDLWGVLLAAGDKMVTDQKLPKKANIRFAWNEYSNFVHRAYIAGSAVVSDRFLVLEGDANIFDATGSALNVSGLNTNEQIFRDNSNWIYYADVQMKPMAPVKVTAKYNDKTQYFIGKQNETVTLLQGSGSEKYLIRMLYDFKTNQLISAYVPGGSDKVNAISTNLMLIRQDNNNATQLIFNREAAHDMETIPADRRAYGVIEFTKERLIDNQSLNVYERSLYWISFPFDVDVSKAICFGEYGKHWVIEEYDGATRAKEGCWLDSESFWKYYWNKNITLEAGKGYVLGLDVDLIRTDDLFGLSGDRPIGIYFPSNTPIDEAIVNQTDVTTSVPEHICTINRATPQGDRRIKDSHWNVIGTPSYVNAIGEYNEFYTTNIETTPKELNYYYQWLGEYNKYSVVQAGTQTFQPLYSYMVQYAGTINWQSIWNENPKAIAAQKYSDNTKEHHLCLEIHKNGNKEDHTFVRLQDKEEVTESFNFNYDLCKIINAGANIYSIITAEASPVEVAANVLPVEETIIPLGVKTDKAGEYTFAMPDGTDGIVVELIDYQANTTTNLLLSDYTITLPKGTNDTRFALHVKPSKVVTGVENIDNSVNGLNGETVKKYLIDGVLYLQKGNLLYDAQGRCVQ